jgi:hypothetical protein
MEALMIYPSRVLSVSIDRSIESVVRYLFDPRNFPTWASGLAGGLSRKSAYAHSCDEANEWVAETPQGQVTIRFSHSNEFGVADHWVHLPDGAVVYVPLRAVANGSGSEVSLTLFRLPSMDDATFRADAEWVERDLAALKQVLESPGERAANPSGG